MSIHFFRIPVIFVDFYFTVVYTFVKRMRGVYLMGSVREEIAKNLLFYRKRKKCTQKDLSEHLGVNNSAVSNWEKGVNSIDIDTLHKACVFLGVSVNDMFGSFSNVMDSDISAEELSLVMSYRNLDSRGKNAVSYTIEKETEYIKQVRPLNKQTDDVYVFPVAARSGENQTIVTSRKQLEEDIKTLVFSDEDDL